MGHRLHSKSRTALRLSVRVQYKRKAEPGSDNFSCNTCEKRFSPAGLPQKLEISVGQESFPPAVVGGTDSCPTEIRL